MSAKDRPTSKASNKKWDDHWDNIFVGKVEVPIGEDTRPKDRVKLGVSPSTVVFEVDCTKKGDEI
jgi:hypothetical protein